MCVPLPDNLLDLAIRHGRGRSEKAAICLGCELSLGLDVHVMACEDRDDPRAIRVYARSEGDIAALEGILYLATLRDGVIVHQEMPRPGRRDLVIYAE